jgi:hypothetical protein
MLQTFTCCTLPQAKERTREVRSLTYLIKENQEHDELDSSSR